MALSDLIYQCPLCGGGTRPGATGEAMCTECERRYEPTDSGWDVRIVEEDGSGRVVRLATLMDRLSRLDEAAGVLRSRVVARFAWREHPVRYRRRFIGYFEERGPDRAGELMLDDRHLLFEEDGGEKQTWPLRDLRAVQTASAAIQVSPLAGGLASFRILDASPRLWEETLKSRIRRVWRAEGRGEVLEFQPRIRSTGLSGASTTPRGRAG